MDDYSERETIVNKYQQGREKVKDSIDPWEDPKFEIYHVTDRYGFIHDSRLPERLTEHEHKLKLQENSRLSKWLKMLNSWESYFPNSEKFKSRVYKGIPDAVRGEVWTRILGVPRIKQEQEGKYAEMLNWGLQHSPDVRQIDLDVNRTYRNHIMFKDRYDTKQQMLFRVLTAYSVYNSEVGYCQGMSQIAALLLMYMDEEDSFWSLSILMSHEKHAMHGFFIPGFPKLVRFSRHHDKVIKKFLPKISKLFRKYNIDSTLYTLKWFFQCFLDRVPFSLTLRLWDCFLYEGEIILTGMSYTLLKLHKRTLLKKGMENLIEFLQIELEKDFGYHDDQAIQALQTSIQELKRHNMLHPSEGPSMSELPSRPFGLLTVKDSDTNSSIFGNDDQSVVGSIILKPADSISLAQTSRTESEIGDVQDDKTINEQNVDNNSAVNNTSQKSLSLYDNVDLNESIEAAKRLTGDESMFLNSNAKLQNANKSNENIKSTDANKSATSSTTSTTSSKTMIDEQNKITQQEKLFYKKESSHSHSKSTINKKESNFINEVTPLSEQIDQLCDELKRFSNECETSSFKNEQITNSHSSITKVLNYELKASKLNQDDGFVQEWPDGVSKITQFSNNKEEILEEYLQDHEVHINSNNEIDVFGHNIVSLTQKFQESSPGYSNISQYKTVESEKITKADIGKRNSPLRTPWKKGSEKRQGLVLMSPTSPTSSSDSSFINNDKKNERPSLIPRYINAKSNNQTSTNSLGSSPSSSSSQMKHDSSNSRIKPLGAEFPKHNNKSKSNQNDEPAKLRIFVPYQYEKQANQYDSNKIKLRIDSPTQLNSKESNYLPAVDT